MNAADLTAWADSHHAQVAAGGVGAVALLAVAARRRAATKATTGAPASAATSANVQTIDPYQSIASDVYNSIQPQIEALQGQVSGGTVGGLIGSRTPTSTVQFPYGKQLQELSNVSGAVVHRWTDQAGHWQVETLATGVDPGGQIAYSLNQFGIPGRIDYSVTQGAQEVHGWYLPGQGWRKESLGAFKNATA